MMYEFQTGFIDLMNSLGKSLHYEVSECERIKILQFTDELKPYSDTTVKNYAIHLHVSFFVQRNGCMCNCVAIILSKQNNVDNLTEIQDIFNYKC